MSTIPLYVRTVTGAKVWLDDPEKSDPLCLDDFAYSFSNTCRFVGQLRNFYSVAEHCVLAARVCEQVLERYNEQVIAPDLALSRPDNFRYQVLMHEPEEPFFGDASTQLKLLCPELKLAGKRLGGYIAGIIGIDWPPPPIIKIVDSCLLRAEHIHLCRNRAYADATLGEFAFSDSLFSPYMFACLHPGAAYQAFRASWMRNAPDTIPTERFNLFTRVSQ